MIRKFVKKLIQNSGNSISREMKIRKNVRIKTSNGGQVIAGRGLLNDNVFLCAVGGGKITLENGVSFNRNSMAVSRGEITIGEGTSIGPNVCIYDHDHFFDKDGFRKNLFKIGKVTIGKNCWIAANVTILRDTTIGDNSIIGAGVVLKGNIEPNSLVKSNRDLIVEKLV